MNWETKAKSLKLNAGTCKGLPLNAEVLFLILLSAKGPFLSGLFGRQNGLYLEMFFLITLTSCHQLRLPTWKLIAQPESTVRGNFGTKEKSRRLNLGPTLNQQWADISIHTLPPPQPAQFLPQTQSLLLIASAWSLDDFLEMTGEQDN